MHCILGKSQHHVDFERQNQGNEQGGGDDASTITERDMQRARE